MGLEAGTVSGTNFEATVESLQHRKEEPPLFLKAENGAGNSVPLHLQRLANDVIFFFLSWEQVILFLLSICKEYLLSHSFVS